MVTRNFLARCGMSPNRRSNKTGSLGTPPGTTVMGRKLLSTRGSVVRFCVRLFRSSPSFVYSL
jgi:hypothetical protein